MSSPSLYAPREPIFPRRVSGYYRRLKWVILIVTLGIYYVTPWLRWDRGPNLSDQAVLVDIANRRFYFFWIEIWPHEFYFVAGLLIMAGLGLFLFTSALGRVWCGYACPQTVWTDLFILVERWIEGDRNARLRLHRSTWTLQKWRLSLTKWAIWLLISVGTGGAWVFYFADAPTLLADLMAFSAHPAAYCTIGFMTLTTFIFGGFMREQICIYACPWPRIQAAMMDEHTLIVGYRDWRGEPRGKANTSDAGDCIDCKACVNVCPMGIDIRNGSQMECITCALCIDACDDVMTRIGKPRGLIDYLALSDEPLEKAGAAPLSTWSHVLRPRNFLYTGLWGSVGLAMLAALFVRTDFEMTVSPNRNPLYVTQSDGAIRNIYEVRLRNKSGEDKMFNISLDGNQVLALEVEGAPAGSGVIVPADTTSLRRVYVTAAPQDAAASTARTEFRFLVHDPEAKEWITHDAVFHGKGT
ncbi:quinol dehydrogenase membrane component [Ruegeria sp. THAF57]|uniref:cytochrome c oxidase accessory protein CcoG n=1 Tax=Ruegeria sp. THAF57 TaxID=2744555 RepID=UPI0015E0595C|nr:cytochrome c oxidase accessory protein CcoG [Ruegeria sp. THAF57]CAD0186786.1 quinol dehydrogenase membrane component [Ruegeria sp. THAF57]